VNLLLDTHAFFWFLDNDPQLSATAKGLIEDPVNRRFVSMGACWEIAIKVFAAMAAPVDILAAGPHHRTSRPPYPGATP